MLAVVRSYYRIIIVVCKQRTGIILNKNCGNKNLNIYSFNDEKITKMYIENLYNFPYLFYIWVLFELINQSTFMCIFQPFLCIFDHFYVHISRAFCAYLAHFMCIFMRIYCNF